MRNKSNTYYRYFTYIKPITRLPIIRTYGSTIFSILVMIIFIFFAIKPTIETILILQKKLENSNEVLQKLQTKAENLSKGKTNYENLDKSLKSRIQSAIPESVDLKSIIQTLENAAEKYDASISALQIQPQVLETKKENQIGNISEVGFTFNVEGDYKKLTSILEDLKLSERLISIDNLTLSKVTEGTGLVMSITGKSWYVK